MLQFHYTVPFNYRNPKAMKAATEEIQRVLEKAGVKISSNRKHISLNRKQLDGMPVLGMLVLIYIAVAHISSISMGMSIYRNN